jgi:hypothetical protein
MGCDIRNLRFDYWKLRRQCVVKLDDAISTIAKRQFLSDSRGYRVS